MRRFRSLLIPGVDKKLLVRDATKLLPDPARRRFIAGGASRGALTLLTGCDVSDSFSAENLLAPDTVRRLAWQPPQPLEPGAVGDALRGLGAREWQIDVMSGPLTRALSRAQTHTSPDRAIQPSA